jgi:hypothetical protein
MPDVKLLLEQLRHFGKHSILVGVGRNYRMSGKRNFAAGQTPHVQIVDFFGIGDGQKIVAQFL